MFKLKKFVLTFSILFLISGSVKSQYKIGVALPLTGSSTENGEMLPGAQIQNGIKDALEEYKATKPGNKVSIVTEDTKKNPSAVLDILNRFGSDSSIIAVLGPVFSMEIVNNAGAALFHKMPVITPTATVNFLAKNNPYVFQLNPTYDIRGRLMAKYALKELDMKHFIILSEDSYGKSFAESFADEVFKNNGTIELTEYFSKDSIAIKDQIEKIKNKIFEKDKFIDFGNLTENQNEKLKNLALNYSDYNTLKSEKSVVSIYKLFGKNAERVMDSMKIFPSVLKERVNVIPGYMDAVYIPLSNYGDIAEVSKVYSSSGINLPILGNSDWNNSISLNESKNFINELYFDSDFYMDNEENNDFKGLSEAEIKNYYFGYDAMKLLLDLISGGNKSRSALNDALEKLTEYKSLHNIITIKERTNHSMSIMKFKNGEIKKVKDYEY